MLLPGPGAPPAGGEERARNNSSIQAREEHSLLKSKL